MAKERDVQVGIGNVVDENDHEKRIAVVETELKELGSLVRATSADVKTLTQTVSDAVNSLALVKGTSGKWDPKTLLGMVVQAVAILGVIAALYAAPDRARLAALETGQENINTNGSVAVRVELAENKTKLAEIETTLADIKEHGSPITERRFAVINEQQDFQNHRIVEVERIVMSRLEEEAALWRQSQVKAVKP